MTSQDILDVCLTKPGAYLDCPFGAEPICARIGKRIFAEVYINKPWVTLKCEPTYGLAMRAQYPEQITRGYHCPPMQQPYNNTVTLTGGISDKTMIAMLEHSYQRAFGCIPKSKRAEALARVHVQSEDV